MSAKALITMTTTSALLAGALLSGQEIPEIDRRQPKEFETATFAMG